MFHITKKIGQTKVVAEFFFLFFYYQNAPMFHYIKCLGAYLKLKHIGVLLYKMPQYIHKTKKCIDAPLHKISLCVHKMKRQWYTIT
jgi:hypothetical protein